MLPCHWPLSVFYNRMCLAPLPQNKKNYYAPDQKTNTGIPQVTLMLSPSLMPMDDLSKDKHKYDISTTHETLPLTGETV